MTKRDRIVLGVVGAAALIAAFWMLVLAPKREQAAELERQTTEETKRRDSALERVRTGEEARRNFADDYATVARLGKAVPGDDQTPSLLYQLQKVAEGESVDFRTMRVRTAGAAAPAAAAAQPASTGTGTAATVPQATQAAAAVAPPGSAVGPAGFPTMPFTFKFEGDFFRMERMFSAIERFTSTIPSGEDVEVRGRLVTVDGFALIESKIFGFPRVNASVAATAYVLPADQGAFAGATPAAPSGSSSTGQTAGAPAPKPPTATASAGGIAP